MRTTLPPRNCSGCIAADGRSNYSSNNSNSSCCSSDCAAAIQTLCARQCERHWWLGCCKKRKGKRSCGAWLRCPSRASRAWCKSTCRCWSSGRQRTLLKRRWGRALSEEADELRRPVSMWLVTACCLSRWRALVLGQWSAARVQLCLPRLRRFLCPSPRRRVHQRLWFLAWVQQRFLGTPFLGTFP